VGVGLYPFQSRKVIHQIQSKTPSPPSTPPPPQNIFKNTLLSSLPSNIIDMYHANQAIKALFQNNSTLHTPERDYIIQLGKKAEGWRAQMTVLEKEKKLFFPLEDL
jgi:hypothetical protein